MGGELRNSNNGQESARKRPAGLNAHLRLIQGVVQSALPAVLDDAYLMRFDPQGWITTPTESAGSKRDHGSGSEDKENAGDGFNGNVNQNGKRERQMVLSEILLAYDLELGPTNTVVNDLPELKIPPVSPVSSANTARLLLTNALHVSILAFRNHCGSIRFNSSINRSITAGEPGATSGKLRELLHIAYPERCAREPEFASSIISLAHAENREEELIKSLSRRIFKAVGGVGSSHDGVDSLDDDTVGKEDLAASGDAGTSSFAFMSMALIEMQINSLEHMFTSSRDPEASQKLLYSTCEGLMSLFELMPLGGLCDLKRWEHQSLNKISKKLIKLSMDADEMVSNGTIVNSDQVNLFLLGLAIQRGSLASALSSILRLLLKDGDAFLPIQINHVLQNLFQRLANVSIYCPMNILGVLGSSSSEEKEQQQGGFEQVHVRMGKPVDQDTENNLNGDDGDGRDEAREKNENDDRKWKTKTYTTSTERENETETDVLEAENEPKAKAHKRKEKHRIRTYSTSSTSSEAARRPKVGDLVMLADPRERNTGLEPGEVGKIIYDDGGLMPYRVSGPRGPSDYWFRQGSLIRIDSETAAAIQNSTSSAPPQSPTSSSSAAYAFQTDNNNGNNNKKQANMMGELDDDLAGDIDEIGGLLVNPSDSIAISNDGRFVYICGESVGGLVKIGSGNSGGSGSPTIPGHVYNKTNLHFTYAPSYGGSVDRACYSWIGVVKDVLFLVTRRAGSLNLSVESFDRHTLTKKGLSALMPSKGTNQTQDRHRLMMTSAVFAEQFIPVRGEKDVEISYGGRGSVVTRLCNPSINGVAIAWCGNGSAWLSGTGKWYFEAKIVQEGKISVGWATPAFFNQAVHSNDSAWLFDSHDGNAVDENGNFKSFGQVCRLGDVIGCALQIDPTKVTISFSRNGNWSGPFGVAFEVESPVLFVRPVIILEHVKLSSPTAASTLGEQHVAPTAAPAATGMDTVSMISSSDLMGATLDQPSIGNSVALVEEQALLHTAYPCVEICCGGIKEYQDEEPIGECKFVYDAPSPDFVAVAWNSGNSNSMDDEGEEEEDEGEDDDIIEDTEERDVLGPLPPLATDGRYFYCIQTCPPLLPPIESPGNGDGYLLERSSQENGLESNHDLVVDILDPLDGMQLLTRRRFTKDDAVGADTPPFERILEWRTFTNGDDLALVYDDEDRNNMEHASGKKRKIGVIKNLHVKRGSSSTYWRRESWPGDILTSGKSLSGSLEGFGSIPILAPCDSFVFSSFHNIVWSWEATNNVLKSFKHDAFASFERKENSSSTFVDGNGNSRLELCTFTLEAICELSKAFTPDSPPQGVFASEMQSMVDPSGRGADIGRLAKVDKDLFLDPSPETFRMLVDLLKRFQGLKEERETRNRGVLCCLQLLLINCTKYSVVNILGSANTGAPKPAYCCDEFTKELLDLLVEMMQNKESNESIKSACAKLVLQSLPMFMQDLEDKINFVAEMLSSGGQHPSLILGGVLEAIGAQLLSRPFMEQVSLLHKILPKLLETVEKEVYARIQRIADYSNTEEETFLLETGTTPLSDACCTVLMSLLVSGLCSVTSTQWTSQTKDLFNNMVNIVAVVMDKSSSILQTACDATLEIHLNRKMSAIATEVRVGALSGVVRGGLVGRVFPMACTWLEFLLRSKQDKPHVSLMLLSSDLSLSHVATFLCHLIRFSSAVTSSGGSLASFSYPSPNNTESKYDDGEKNVNSNGNNSKNIPPRLRRRSSTIVAAAAIAAQRNEKMKTSDCSKPIQYEWARTFSLEREYESAHEYGNYVQERWLVDIPGADVSMITFDPKTSTEERRDFLRFLRVPASGNLLDVFSGGHADLCPEDARYGQERYSGPPGQWPGTGNVPPLMIPSGRFVVTFTTDGSDVDWGYKFLVRSHITERKQVTVLPWFTHVSAICRDFVASLVHATVGINAKLSDNEGKHLRWIQNPILSGGLKDTISNPVISVLPSASLKKSGTGGDGSSSSTPPPVPTLQNPHLKRVRVRSRSSSRSMSMSEDDKNQSEQMLLEFISDVKPPPNLGGALFKFLRDQRVPLDQGYFTHRAAASLAAALIRVNGLEREALRIARTILQGGTPEAPSTRLLKVWTIAQNVRSWADQLVVNNQVQHHIEASLPPGSDLQARLLNMVARAHEFDDPEEPLYDALCEILAQRARFLILDVCPPTSRMISLRSARQDAARARWHRLRRHFCPKTQRLLQSQERWEVVVGAVRVLSSLRSIVDMRRSAAQRMALPITRSRAGTLNRQRSAELPPTGISSPVAGTSGVDVRERSLSRERSFSRDRIFSKEQLPNVGNGTIGEEEEESSMMSTSGGTPRKRKSLRLPLLRLSRNSGALIESPMNTPPHLLSAKSASSTSSANSTSSHFSFQGTYKRRERMSGGLRRASTMVESDGDVDIIIQEHDQSLSESVDTFLKAPVPIDGQTLRYALENRNERAVMRIAGFEFINTLIGLARSQQRYGEARLLFDSVLLSTSRALRGYDNTHSLSKATGLKLSICANSDDQSAVAAVAAVAAAVVSTSYGGAVGPQQLGDVGKLSDGEEEETGHDEGGMGDNTYGEEDGDDDDDGQNQQSQQQHDDENGEGGTPSLALESHYLTDLPGCTHLLRETVAEKFESFLRSISALLQLTVRQYGSAMKALRGERKITDKVEETEWHRQNLVALSSQLLKQMQQFIVVGSLDYVESDFGLLANSEIVNALRAVLFYDFNVRQRPPLKMEYKKQLDLLMETDDIGESIRSMAWKCFELLVRRCICEGGQAGAGFMSGNSLQQDLLDVLVSLLERSLQTFNNNNQVLIMFTNPPITTSTKNFGPVVQIIDPTRSLNFGMEGVSLVGPRICSTQDFSINFGLVLHRNHIRPGRIFSIGNPQIEVDAIGLTNSQYIAGPPTKFDARFAWLEVGIDKHRRLTVEVGDLAGLSVLIVSEYALPLDEVCNVSIGVEDFNSVEIHLLSIFPEDDNSPEQRVYTVEMFKNAAFEIGQLPVDFRDETGPKCTINTGDYVRIFRGPFTGYTGLVLGIRKEMACVNINLYDVHQPVSMQDEVLYFTICIELSGLLLVPTLSPSLFETMSSYTYKTMMDMIKEEKIGRNDEERVVKLMTDIGFDVDSLATGLALYREHKSQSLPIPDVYENGMKSTYSLTGPFYLGSCPDWGMGMTRPSVRGVTLKELSVSTTKIVPPHGTETVAPAVSEIQPTSARPPNPSCGGVKLSFPIAELLSSQNMDPVHVESLLLGKDLGAEESEDSDAKDQDQERLDGGSAAMTTFEGGPTTTYKALLERFEKDNVRTLQTLLLTYAACTSPVGRARLTAPFPLTLLLQTCVAGSAPLELRIASAKVLSVLLLDVSPLTASLCAKNAMTELSVPSAIEDGDNTLIYLITRTIGQYLYRFETTRNDKTCGEIVSHQAMVSFSMAMQLVELLHTLCAKEVWAQSLSRWIALELNKLADKLSGDGSSGQYCPDQALAALALLGGVYEYPRHGGRAYAVSSGGLMSKSEVVILGHVEQPSASGNDGNKKRYIKLNKTVIQRKKQQQQQQVVDITGKMKVHASTSQVSHSIGSPQAVLETSANYWESNGYTPHWIQLTAPSAWRLQGVSMYTNESFENYSPDRVEVRIGPATESLRTIRVMKLQLSTKWIELVTPADVRKTDRVFRLEINSNHAGGCDSRIQQFKVLGQRADIDDDEDETETVVRDRFFVRQVYGSDVEEDRKAAAVHQGESQIEAGANNTNAKAKSSRMSSRISSAADDGKPQGKGAGSSGTSSTTEEDQQDLISIEDGVSLAPIALTPPIQLLDALNEDIVVSLQRIIKDEVGSTLLKADIRSRAMKVICVLLDNQTMVESIGEALLPQLLFESKLMCSSTINQQLVDLPVKFGICKGVSQRLRMDFDEDTVTFNVASKLHRVVALDVSPMVHGKHYWECTLLADTRDDETSLFGITSLARLGSEFGSKTVENLLKPSPDFWLLQSYNGQRLHAGIPAQWEGSRAMKVHPGDSVRFLLDMDAGTLCIGVNNEPLVRVFYGIDREVLWGVYPCVATYGNHSKVRIKISNMKTSHSKIGSTPQRHLLTFGADYQVEARAARISALLHENGDSATLNGKRADETGSSVVMENQQSLDGTTMPSEYDGIDPSELSDDEDENEGGSDDDGSPGKDSAAMDMKAALSGADAISASQQMIQRINALYEVADSSAELEKADASALTSRMRNRSGNSSFRRLRDVHVLSMGILSDPRFVVQRDWLCQAGKEIFSELYSRLSVRALEQMVVDWSAVTSQPLPYFLLEPSALEKTINLIYRNCEGKLQSRSAVDAIVAICHSKQDEDEMPTLLLSQCVETLSLVGARLSQSVLEVNKRTQKMRNERETEERESAAARAQVIDAQASVRKASSMNPEKSQPAASTTPPPAPPLSALGRSMSNSIAPLPETTASGASSAPSTSTSALKVGDLIRARFMGGRNWYRGRISIVFSDGTYGVDYDDGDKETHVPRSMIQLLPTEGSTSSSSTAFSSTNSFTLGDKVEARFKRDFKWFPGRITRAHHDSQTYDVQYDDGDFERRVPARYIRRPDRGTPSSSVAPVLDEPAPSSVPPPPPPPPPQSGGGGPSSPSSMEGATIDAEIDGDGTYLLIADRYRGDIPPSGKADSAQVSIINSPCTADGRITSVKLRLAEPPAGGLGSWDVIVVERAGDTSTFFVVAGTPSRPTRATVYFDPNVTEIQTVPVPTPMYIAQGQYLGVINPRGRLNVAYTPGKKKIEESWALKPVEVFYLMPKNVPIPFVGGPHRTRLWHGRAGWCATVLVTSSFGVDDRPRYLRQSAEEIFASISPFGSLRVEEAVRQACWLVNILAREGLLKGGAMKILSETGLIEALRRVCQHGIFFIDGDSQDLEETSSPLFTAWLPVVDTIQQLCVSIVESAHTNEMVLPRRETEALIRLQSVLERKVHDMNKERQKRLRDLVKSKTSIVSSEQTNTPQPIQPGGGSGGLGGGGSGNNSSNNNNSSSSNNNNPNSGNNTTNELFSSNSSGTGPVPAATPGAQQKQPRLKSGGDDEDESSSSSTGVTGIRFQRLLKCLVSMDDLTRKDGLDGEIFLVDSPRRSLNEQADWEDHDVTIVAQSNITPPVMSYEHFNGRLCIGTIRENNYDKKDNEETKNLEEVKSKLKIGDELIAVEGHFLDGQPQEIREMLIQIGIAGPKVAKGSQGSSGGVAGGHSADPKLSSTASISVDFTKPYYYNSVLFPPLYDARSGSTAMDSSTSSSSASSDGRGRANSSMGSSVRGGSFSEQGAIDVDSILGKSEIKLTFRRRQGDLTFSQVAHAGKGISYRGVQGFFQNRNMELDNAEWLDSLVTATELLKAFSSQTLPPERFLKEQFGQWAQAKKRGELESCHPIDGESSEVEYSDRLTISGGRSHKSSVTSSPLLLKRLSRQRTHSRAEEVEPFSLSPMVDEYASTTSKRKEEGRPRTKPSPLTLTPGMVTTTTTTQQQGENSSSTNHEQSLSIPGATALKLTWDQRSCLKLNSNEKAIALRIGDQTIYGYNGLPPNVTVVTGSSVTVFVDPNPKLGKKEEPFMVDSEGIRQKVQVAGLQNRAGAYIWLGTKPNSRGKFYCGRNWSDVVGWSIHHGQCGPFGDKCCPDCANFTAKNFAGYPMLPGSSSTPKRHKDLLYCMRCDKDSAVPCVDCRRFLSVMIRTRSMTQIPYRKRSDFESNIEYGNFIGDHIVPGMTLRILHSSKRNNVRAGMFCVVKSINCDTYTCNVSTGHHTSTVEIPLHHLELLTVKEIGGVDNRNAVLDPEETFSQQQQAGTVDESAAMEDGDDDGQGNETTKYLEASDFLSSTEYNKYMARNCHVGCKVRCSRRYESVEEGDIGEVIKIDDGDDLPCQVMWQGLASQYWLPWSHLSLNLTKPREHSLRSLARTTTASSVLAMQSLEEDRSTDDTSVTFDTNFIGNGIELYNNNRSMTRNTRNGWGTQRVNKLVDSKVGKVNIYFRIDSNSSHKLFLGVIDADKYDGKNAMDERYCYSLKKDGSLYVDGIEVRSKTPSKSFQTNDVITVSIDVSSNSTSLTFLKGNTVIDLIPKIPGRVYPCVSLSSSYQRVSIDKVEIGAFAKLFPIQGWGFKVVVEPSFDSTRLVAHN